MYISKMCTEVAAATRNGSINQVNGLFQSKCGTVKGLFNSTIFINLEVICQSTKYVTVGY